MSVVETDHADVIEALDFGGGEIFEKPSRKLGTKQMEIGTTSRAEVAQTTFVAGENIDSILRLVESLEGAGSGGEYGGGSGFWWSRRLVRGDWGSEWGLGHGWAANKMNPALVKPKLDFFVTTLVGGRFLKNNNVDGTIMIEVGDNGISEFGDGAGADVAFNTIFVLVHKEEGVGGVKVVIKAFVGFGKGVGLVGRQGVRIVKDLVATTFKVAAPVGDCFGEFAGTGNDNCFHRRMGWVE